MVINVGKSRMLRFGRQSTQNSIKTEPYDLEQVKTFKYLRVFIANTRDAGPELKRKIQAAARAFHNYKKFLNSKTLSRQKKFNVDSG